MNDLQYIFYDAKRMYLDTSDMSCEGERAHRRLCDFIWFSDSVPFNNDDSLKQISHTKDADWCRVKGELCSKGWRNVGEYFLHRGAVKSLNDSKVRYVENVNRQAKMNKVEPLTLTSPDSVTGIVTHIVMVNVTDTVDALQSESDKETKRELGAGAGDASIPSLAEVQAEASIRAVPDASVKAFWDHYHGNNLWINQHGKIINWQHKLITWAVNDRQPKGNTNHDSHRRPTAPDRNSGTYNANPGEASIARLKAKVR